MILFVCSVTFLLSVSPLVLSPPPRFPRLSSFSPHSTIGTPVSWYFLLYLFSDEDISSAVSDGLKQALQNDSMLGKARQRRARGRGEREGEIERDRQRERQTDRQKHRQGETCVCNRVVLIQASSLQYM